MDVWVECLAAKTREKTGDLQQLGRGGGVRLSHGLVYAECCDAVSVDLVLWKMGFSWNGNLSKMGFAGNAWRISSPALPTRGYR
jgi:hypothetical protein